MTWQKYRVELVGREPVEVQTNAFDWVGVPIDPASPKAMDISFRVAHSALLRAGTDGVPRSYVEFLGVLDGIPTELDGAEEGAGPMDPTESKPSDA